MCAKLLEQLQLSRGRSLEPVAPVCCHHRTVQVVAYDGSDFAGFQWQPKARTVQGEIEKAAARVLLPAGRVVGE